MLHLSDATSLDIYINSGYTAEFSQLISDANFVQF